MRSRKKTFFYNRIPKKRRVCINILLETKSPFFPSFWVFKTFFFSISVGFFVRWYFNIVPPPLVRCFAVIEWLLVEQKSFHFYDCWCLFSLMKVLWSTTKENVTAKSRFQITPECARDLRSVGKISFKIHSIRKGKKQKRFHILTRAIIGKFISVSESGALWKIGLLNKCCLSFRLCSVTSQKLTYIEKCYTIFSVYFSGKEKKGVGERRERAWLNIKST